MRRFGFLVGAVLVLPGCAKGTSGGNPFGSQGSGMTPMEGDDDDDDSDTDEDEDEDTGAMTSGISGGGSSTGDSDPATTSAGDSSTSTPPGNDSSSDGGVAEDGSSSTGMPPDGNQPATGMYAHCYDMFSTNCTAPSTICVNITGEMEGFCTADGCLSPAVDCDPAPGGTAAPFCLSAGGYSVCALDCSSGESCAGGMVCTTVSFDGVVDYDLCM
jgi:hypothetical protein